MFRIEALTAAHNRKHFLSGSISLDSYFRENVSQDVKRRIAICFVAITMSDGEVAGFYTLSATSVALHALAPDIVKKLPRYPVVPAALLGRLAVTDKFQGRGLGSALLSDAFLRVSAAELGVFAMLVDAKDENAQRFYEHFGFKQLSGSYRRLCLPIATALSLGNLNK